MDVIIIFSRKLKFKNRYITLILNIFFLYRSDFVYFKFGKNEKISQSYARKRQSFPQSAIFRVFRILKYGVDVTGTLPVLTKFLYIKLMFAKS